MTKSQTKGLPNRNIFHIAGFILNNTLIRMENGCLKTQTYHPNLELPAPKQNLLNEIYNNPLFLPENSLQEGVVQLLNNDIPYFITSNPDLNDKYGFFLYFKMKDGQIAARHFNVINNRVIKNVHLYLYEKPTQKCFSVISEVNLGMQSCG